MSSFKALPQIIPAVLIRGNMLIKMFQMEFYDNAGKQFVIIWVQGT